MTTPARQHTLVAAAVESLRPEHRQVLLKAYFQGYSVSEVAEELGLPRPLVKQRIYEAMRQLRDTLARDGLRLEAAAHRGRLAA